MKKFTQKLLTLMLALSMFLSTSIVGVNAASEKKVDDLTLNTYKDVFDVGDSTISTEDIGRIWTDKSVSEKDITLNGDIGQNVSIKKDEKANFLVALSALGSAANIKYTNSADLDVLFILDASPKMGEDNKAKNMVQATNLAIDALFKENPDNRVGVIAYSDHAGVLLPLASYKNTGKDYLSISGDTIISNGLTNGGTEKKEFEIRGMASGVDKYTQSGLAAALNIIRNETDAEVKGRTPEVILLSEGEPKDGDTRVTSPPMDTNNNIQKYDTGREEEAKAQTFATLMTSAYLKKVMNEKYDTDKSNIYTIGINTEMADAPELAKICLNPSANLNEEFKNYYEKFKNDNKVEIIRGMGPVGVVKYYAKFNDFPNEFRNDSADILKYNTKFYDVKNANTPEEWEDIFKEIVVNSISINATSPVETPSGGSASKDGYITFTDQLGKYMEIKDIPSIVYAGKEFKAKIKEENNNVTTYKFEGEVSGNEIYGDANLSDIIFTVENNDDSREEKVTLKIPSSILPLRVFDVNYKIDGRENEIGSIKLKKEAYPIRAFYSVGKMDNINYENDKDLEYYRKNSKDGKTKYIQNDSNLEKYTKAEFIASENNSYYNHLTDVELYVLQEEGGTEILSTSNAVENIDKSGKVVVNGKTYKLTLAKEFNENNAYYYEHIYFKGNENKITKISDYHKIKNNKLLKNNTVVIDGILHVQNNYNKFSIVDDDKAKKTNGVEGLAEYYRYPVMEETNTHKAKMSIYLGNNGIAEIDTPLQEITIKNNSDEKMIHKIELFNQDGSTKLAGEYKVIKVENQVESDLGNISNESNKISIEPKSTVKIYLPIGSKYKLSSDDSEVIYKIGNSILDFANNNKLEVRFNPLEIVSEKKQGTAENYHTVTLKPTEGVVYHSTIEDVGGVYKVKDGESFEFSIVLKDGYKISESGIKVDATNNVTVSDLTNNNYKIDSLQNDTEITVSGIEKIQSEEKHKVKLISGAGYTLEKAEEPITRSGEYMVQDGAPFRYKLILHQGYKITNESKIVIQRDGNDEEVAIDENNLEMEIDSVTSDVTIYAKNILAPGVDKKIEIYSEDPNDSKADYIELVPEDKIEIEKYYNSDVFVKISGNGNISYFVSDKYLSKDELENKKFTTYSGEFKIAAAPNSNKTQIVYAKISDSNGTTYLSTNLFMIDTVDPFISIKDSWCTGKEFSIFEPNMEITGIEIEKIDEDNYTITDKEDNKGFNCTINKEGTYKITATDKAENISTKAITIGDHSYKENKKEPTCTENGYSFNKCEVCGDEKDKTEIPKLGHDMGEWEISGNKKTRKCKRVGCTYEETETIGGGTTGGGSSSGGTSSGGSSLESDIVGKDRYETAGLIADRIDYYNSVILVNANEALADGLSAAALSGKENAPILLVKKDSIPKATMDRIKDVSKVYIIGGENAVSKKVEEQLKGKTIERIGGKDRIETSMLIAKKLGSYNKAFIVNGYTGEADAMSASAAAAKYKAPIILTNGKKSKLAKKSNVDYYAVGGNAVLEESLVDKYDAERLGGKDRYETNRLVIEELYKYSSKYYYTKGNPLVDALTISLHAKDNGVVLVSPKSDNSILKGKDIVKVGGMNFEIEPIK